MNAPTPWLGTEPGDVPLIDLSDEVWQPLHWWERMCWDWFPDSNDIDRACGPEYRMNWEQING